MRDEPSATAGWVASWRGLATKLPADARIAVDPYGSWFAPATMRWLGRLPSLALSPGWPALLYMQVRTRVLDDQLRAFVAAGGRQVVLLGAGYDCRALRFADLLRDARVFEVDHPATQGHKRAVFAQGGVQPRVTWVPWNFEQRPVSELPAALAAEGHDPALPTLTVWEGVTMYLTEAAIDASVRAVAAYSAPGSPFAVTWLERDQLVRPGFVRTVVSKLVAASGEPFVWGWEPPPVGPWFAERGFALERDADMVTLAADLLPPAHARLVAHVPGHHVAVLRRSPA